MLIYKTTNLVNGKIYVGKDGHGNDNYLGSGTILKQAIKKYGRKNFKKETLEVCDGSNWVEREIYWISKLDARNKDVGYNIAKGGENPPTLRGEASPWYGKHHSEESRKKIAESHKGKISPLKGKKLNEEQRLKAASHLPHYKGKDNYFYGKSFSGEASPWYGRKHSEETRKKMSKNHANVCGNNNPLFGKKRTDEEKQKMSETKKRKFQIKKLATILNKVVGA